jgi:UDP-glucuronate decarboxylase
MIDLAKLIKELINKDVGIELINYPTSYPEDEPNRRCPDISKISKELSFNPKVDLEKGLVKFFQWAKENYSIEILQ